VPFQNLYLFRSSLSPYSEIASGLGTPLSRRDQKPYSDCGRIRRISDLGDSSSWEVQNRFSPDNGFRIAPEKLALAQAMGPNDRIAILPVSALVKPYAVLRSKPEIHAALPQLLVLLSAGGAIPQRHNSDPISVELGRFDTPTLRSFCLLTIVQHISNATSCANQLRFAIEVDFVTQRLPIHVDDIRGA